MENTKPIYSRFQLVAGEGPEIHRPFFSSELISLNGSFQWHHHDLCLFHQSIYANIQERINKRENYILKESDILNTKLDVDEIGLDEIFQSPIRETINAWDIEINNIRSFADQLLIVGLWSTVEQYLTRTLILAEKEKGNYNARIPYQWNGLQNYYSNIGVDISKCKGYDIVIECRILNNKIKHSGEVDSMLSKFENFKYLKGKPLTRIYFKLQNYSDAVYEFTGNVMELTDEVLFKKNE